MPDAGADAQFICVVSVEEFPVVDQNPLNPIAFAYIYGDVPNLIGVEVRYEATNVPPIEAWPEGRPVHPPVFYPVEIPYGEKAEVIDGGWQFRIDLQEDCWLVRDAFLDACLLTGGAPDIALRRIEFHFITADSSWVPPGASSIQTYSSSPERCRMWQTGMDFSVPVSASQTGGRRRRLY